MDKSGNGWQLIKSPNAATITNFPAKQRVSEKRRRPLSGLLPQEQDTAASRHKAPAPPVPTVYWLNLALLQGRRRHFFGRKWFRPDHNF